MKTPEQKAEEYAANTYIVQKQGKSKLSDNSMASLMYAIVMCKAELVQTHGIGIYQYNRKQNRRHYFDFILSINKNMIAKFEEITNIKLEDPISIILN